MHEFIYAVGVVVVVGVLWIGYELHQIRQELRYVRVKQITDRLVEQVKGSPQLFDQEDR